MINPTMIMPGSLPPPHDTQPRLLTAADLAAIPTDLPSGTVRYELHHGRLVVMAPTVDLHGAIENKVSGAFLYMGEYKGLGKSRCGEVGIVLGRNPDHVLGADALFVANSRLPLRHSSEGYLESIPHIVVEVRSKNETIASLARKAQEYLAAGAVVVWVLDSIQRNVVEYRKDAQAKIYTEEDTLTVEDVIPGFTLAVRQALQD